MRFRKTSLKFFWIFLFISFSVLGRDRIAVYTGSFDPPVKGHTSVVEESFNQLNVDEVWIGVKILDEKNYLLGFHQRMELLRRSMRRLAPKKIKFFVINTNDRPNLMRRIVDSRNADFIHILGEDVFNKNYRRLLEISNLNFAIMDRTGVGSPISLPPSRTVRIREALPNTSSTQARIAIERGDRSEMRRLLSREVLELIDDEEFYRPVFNESEYRNFFKQIARQRGYQISEDKIPTYKPMQSREGVMDSVVRTLLQLDKINEAEFTTISDTGIYSFEQRIVNSGQCHADIAWMVHMSRTLGKAIN